MNKRLYVAAQRIVKKALEKVTDSATHREIQALCSVGLVKGKSIFFTPAERKQIEQYFSKSLGKSLREIDLTEGSRTTMSGETANEKLATGGVFDGLISLARFKKALPIHSRNNIYTPEGCVFSCRLEQIDATAIDSLVVVENGEAITHWHRVVPMLPETFHSSLFAYRGHGTNQKTIQQLIASLQQTANVAIFGDLDPSGVDIGLQLLAKHAGYFMVPKDDFASFRAFSKHEEYDNQAIPLKRLLESNDKLVVALAKKLQSNRIAVTQEHLICKRVALEGYPLNSHAS